MWASFFVKAKCNSLSQCNRRVAKKTLTHYQSCFVSNNCHPKTPLIKQKIRISTLYSAGCYRSVIFRMFLFYHLINESEQKFHITSTPVQKKQYFF